jgi:RND superfamily putative drug exporter
METLGRFGRIGLWTADHRRAVVLAWLTVIVGLGGLAPFAEHALSGAGWVAVGSQSDREAKLVDRSFPGQGSYALLAVVRADAGLRSPAGRETVARVRRVLQGSSAVRRVLPIQAAPDGRTGIVEALAAKGPTSMVQAAERLEKPLAAAAASGATVRLTGPAAMWADFNTNNKNAMMRSEVLSWPLTMALLVLAFGTLVAAGLPLLLTMAGLASAAGFLFLGAQLMDISIWAMNFAMMFAIALGIDYALFVVVRFRGALADGADPREATGVAMETAGKAVFTSGLAVFAALMAVALVPSPTFRTVPLGIALSVCFVLAASLTLLPAVLSRLGSSVDGCRSHASHAGACAAAATATRAGAGGYGAARCGTGRARPPSSRCLRLRHSRCEPRCRRSLSSPTTRARGKATTSSGRRTAPGSSRGFRSPRHGPSWPAWRPPCARIPASSR